ALVLLVLALYPPAARPAGVPPGFLDEPFVSIGSPTSMAWLPDGSMLVATQPGQLRLGKADGTLQAAPVLGLTRRMRARTVLGVAASPWFATDHAIFVYWTYDKFGSCPEFSLQAPVNRVSRFTLQDGVATGEQVLVDNIPSFNGNHNAGDLKFGRDGMLYVS